MRDPEVGCAGGVPGSALLTTMDAAWQLGSHSRRRGDPAAPRSRTAPAGFVPAAKRAGIVGKLDVNDPPIRACFVSARYNELR